MPTPLSPDQLRRSFDASKAEFETTAELKPATTIIGQPRGVQAIEFGLNMQMDGYNIFVLGASGTGRTTAIQQYVEDRAANDPVPSDWVYVHNFIEPDKPAAIELPAGKACYFRDALGQVIRKLRGEIARAFDNQAFRDAVLEIRHVMADKREQLFVDLQEKAKSRNAFIATSAEGLNIVPAREGKPLQAQEFAALSAEEKAAWKGTFHALQHELNETMYQAHKLEKSAEEELEELKRRVASSVVDVAMTEIKEQAAGLEEMAAYLERFHQDILDNVDLFRTEEGEDVDDLPPERFRRYQVNVLVDHQRSEHAPVIVEFNPNLPRLLGRVEHEARAGGAIVTDFTLIRAGTLHAANGGYLVLRARDIFAEMGAWEALKRALVGGLIEPDDPATRGGRAIRSLDPRPIPLAVKVILIGPAILYYLLHGQDEDFRTTFKVMADFDESVARNPENEEDYATFIATRVHEEGLLHLNKSAVGRVIEYGSRLAGTQNKLSTRFGQIADLVREACYWAGENGHDLVTVDDVERAIDNREYLQNRIETHMREQLMEGKQLVTTSGSIAGQINGLSVRQIGEHAFGHPSRITARTFVGKEGVIQIDREAELAGSLHDKGLFTLIGYLGGQYADDMPLSLSAQVTFEQNYGGIDGDSASSTELYALLSSLSDFPINQGIAVTGSVNQWGEIQAIGGVTQKVEGWYAVCKEQGLTGEQGVIIPRANAKDLMLRVAVVEAVAAGKFHLWAIENIDQGLEVLTGRSPAEIHTAVKSRLSQLAQTMKEYNS
ncbi:MAG: ATP-binding protein [Candidatus Promineifilaceae bacterium]|nr:ATP-binding protein [Candidatus Promineifilaceae bacterium]